jgi:predicted RNA-binding protein YlxR (DUF448 family)
VVEASGAEAPLSQGSVRMCIGCRERADRSVLLRVVVAEVDGVLSVVPDPRRRQPGRGASLHPDLRCLDLAERRRAFSRALRVGVALASGPVRAYLQNEVPTEPSTESGSDADEHSMSDQR